MKSMLLWAAVLLHAALLNAQDMKPLTEEERRVIVDKGTEMPFTGKYYRHDEQGVYRCRQCGAPLYRSEDKFDAGCGWPSFDDQIEGAVRRVPDADGRRTEIVCAHCGGHLGHVFEGERFTRKNVRHCVNSLSLDFKAQPAAGALDTAYYAGGCFWGVEYFMERTEGVVDVESGYMGGTLENPSYEQVCRNRTGHAETVRVVYDPGKISYEELTKRFLEIHDPTQVGRQGPDIGDQYRSEIFYTSPAQQTTARRLLEELRKKGYRVATRLSPAAAFWPAERYHQDYYKRKGAQPYCHGYTKRF